MGSSQNRMVRRRLGGGGCQPMAAREVVGQEVTSQAGGDERVHGLPGEGEARSRKVLPDVRDDAVQLVPVERRGPAVGPRVREEHARELDRADREEHEAVLDLHARAQAHKRTSTSGWANGALGGRGGLGVPSLGAVCVCVRRSVGVGVPWSTSVSRWQGGG